MDPKELRRLNEESQKRAEENAKEVRKREEVIASNPDALKWDLPVRRFVGTRERKKDD
jgi:hypothetical protein